MKDWQDKINTIIQGDCLEVLKGMPDDFVDMVISSPPYYGLRNYGIDGQLGLEDTFEEFLDKMMAIMAEIKRVVKPTGTIWINFGDCYGTGSGKGSRENTKQATNKGSNYYDDIGKNKVIGYEKCLLMMPERFAIRCIDELGLILRNKIKWAKQVYLKKQGYTVGSVMPTSVRDRFNESGEELYFFVKNKKYYFNLDAVRLPPQSELNFERPRMGQGNQTIYEQKRAPWIIRQKDYPESKYNKFNYRVRDAKRKEGQPQFKASEEEIKNYQGKFAGNKNAESFNSPRARTQRYAKGSNYEQKYKELKDGGLMPATQRVRGFFDEFGGGNNPAGKNLPTVWQIGSEPHNFQKEYEGIDSDHFAIFPQSLLEIPILAGCPPGGIVLDPFGGSMTTAVVAKKLRRNYIMIELSPKYIEIGKKRLSFPEPML